MFRRFSLILMLLFIFSTLKAQPLDPNEYPTLIALEQAAIPVRDRIQLGRELLGIMEIAPPPAEPETYTLGERRSFKALNSSINRIFQFEAELKAIGEHIYLWVDTRANVTNENAQGLADIFDSKIYPETRDLWGVEASPGIDADTRVFGLFTFGLGGNVAAYYSSSNTYPSEVVADSNEHELFIYDLGASGEDVDSWIVQSTTAHEFQHMIRDNMNTVQDSWLNEGLSVFTQLYLGYDDGAWSATAYQDHPETQLNAWGEGNTGAHYGGASMWVTYFYERYGLKALQTVSLTSLPSMTAFDRYLQSIDAPGVNELFADWVLANWWRDTNLADGRYGYALMPGLNAPARKSFNAYPSVEDDQANQYSTDYYVLRNLPDTGTLTIDFESPETVQLIPTDAYSGDWMWYSHRNDDSVTTLTQEFDLTSVDSATLEYKVWYMIEDRWDYGYLMVSTDNGATWQILETPNTTDANPHGNSYGHGYTDLSDGWLAEAVSLDEYVGQSILIRFAMITDDASNLAGMALDDIAIPELNYFSDFESDAGGWQTEGWIRMDNVLPQQTWVQVSQRSDDDFTVTRWLYPRDRDMTVDLLPDADEVVLSISPFATLTTVAMPYTVALDVRP